VSVFLLIELQTSKLQTDYSYVTSCDINTSTAVAQTSEVGEALAALDVRTETWHGDTTLRNTQLLFDDTVP
jgi:hypothetical protein